MNAQYTTPLAPETSPILTKTAKAKIKVKFNLICASKCKRHILDIAKAIRPANKFTRVSEEFLISCEAALKNHIHSRVKSHPSKGKTLM